MLLVINYKNLSNHIFVLSINLIITFSMGLSFYQNLINLSNEFLLFLYTNTTEIFITLCYAKLR